MNRWEQMQSIARELKGVWPHGDPTEARSRVRRLGKRFRRKCRYLRFDNSRMAAVMVTAFHGRSYSIIHFPEVWV